ncbi:hypothetical protein VP01_444g6 [Puccinia sorghi]|uniref:Uncharacterized protein n=1 Tax=Puccinia sorghi TaxID=27349 RepID=A0A0L6UPE8_9BASI|nr:hypothetical protein VP01_444g6 [Puccinia sorghi]
MSQHLSGSICARLLGHFEILPHTFNSFKTNDQRRNILLRIHSGLSIFLPRKWREMDLLKEKEAAGSQENTFHPMYHKMITKIEEYQEKALECEVLVMATLILHPEFCLRLFSLCWPEREQHVQLLLEKNFDKKEAQIQKRQDHIKELEETPKVDENNIF